MVSDKTKPLLPASNWRTAGAHGIMKHPSVSSLPNVSCVTIPGLFFFFSLANIPVLLSESELLASKRIASARTGSAPNHREWTMNPPGSALPRVHWQLTLLKKMFLFPPVKSKCFSNMSSNCLFRISVGFAIAARLRSKLTTEQTLITLPYKQRGWTWHPVFHWNLGSSLILFNHSNIELSRNISAKSIKRASLTFNRD